MMRRTTQRFLASAGFALAALASSAPRTLSAQAAGSAEVKDTVHATDSTATSRAIVTTSVPRYLVTHGRELHLTAKQSDRIREVAKWLDSANAPLRAQWQQVTGGRPLRSMSRPQRRTLAPQLQPIAQQMKTNNGAALDSVDAILTPPQQERLQAVLQEYRRRMQERQAHAATAPPAQP